MKELKSTLKVFDVEEIKGREGHGKGHVQKVLLGNEDRPSERILASLNTFEPGTHINLHWHPIEGIYYCIAGRAIITDVEGKGTAATRFQGNRRSCWQAVARSRRRLAARCRRRRLPTELHSRHRGVRQ